jgi:hypothetical protein
MKFEIERCRNTNEVPPVKLQTYSKTPLMKSMKKRTPANHHPEEPIRYQSVGQSHQRKENDHKNDQSHDNRGKWNGWGPEWR